MVTFVEHPVFTRQIDDLLTNDEFRDFQNYLALNPTAGDVIPGLTGLRKLRWALPGRGKRGGMRVIYLLLVEGEVIFLFYAYSKGDMPDLTKEQKSRLRTAVATIKKEYSK